MRKICFSLIFISQLFSNDDIILDEQKNNIQISDEPQVEEKPIKRVQNKLQYKGTVVKKVERLRNSNINFSNETTLEKFKKVSLNDVVLETLSNSDMIRSAREKVIQSQLKLDDGLADYYPTLNFEYTYSKTRHYPGEDDNSRYKFYNDRNYRFVMAQNLFAGGATYYNVKSLRESLLVQRNMYKLTVQEELNKAIKAYFGVVFSKKAVEVNKKHMIKLQRILDIVTIKYDNGASSIGDLTSIKANVSNAQTKLIKDKSKLEEALRYYEYIVGKKFSKTLPYERDFNIKIAQFDKLFQRAVSQNPNLKNYYLNIEAEKYKVQNAQSKFSPKVDLEVTYNDIKDQEDYEGDENDFTGRVKLTYNLFNGGKDKNKVLRSYSILRDLKFRLNEEIKKLKWNLSKLHTSINSVKDALKSTKSEVSSSQEAVEAYWEAFKLGEQDLNVLLQGQRQLNSAELELIKFERSNIQDFFLLLGYTGDLLAYFNIDPENNKFVNFSTSTYNKKLYDDLKDKKLLFDEEIKEKIVDKKEKKEQKPKEVKKEPSLNENIDLFIKTFLQADENSFMIIIKDFDNVYDAFDFIKEQKISKESFAFDILKKYKIKTIIARKIFDNELDARQEMKKMSKTTNKSLELKTIKDIKELYIKYLEGLEVKVKEPKPKVKIIEKIQMLKKQQSFKTNEDFKKRFLEANKENYTINIATFTSMKEAISFAKKEQIYDNSFVFKYIEGKELVKVMYGVFENYEDAVISLDILDDIKQKYYPVIEKIQTKQNLYKQNKELNEKEKKTQEYEIVTKSKIVDSKEDKKEDKKKDKKENRTKSLNDFEALFLEVPKNYYTINLATINTKEEAKEFTLKHGIEDTSFVFSFGDKNLAKVMYGVFENYEQAKKALEELPLNLRKNSPYIEKIAKKQDLYNKYHSLGKDK
ncbi:TolC family protein [Malaciobacter marinus]|uniref:TolC family protein n=1 Tax=Malaciobacter marinus TaxID=505249 RepID=UPI0009A79933|nr:TolC family protein [Malaciobacter marinus]SKB37954.1 Outer membrane protein TolC [Malaciobacter marinus]